MALNVACDVISLVISSIAAGVMGQLVLGAIGRVDVEVLSVSPSCAAAGKISAQHATAFSREYVMDVARTRAVIVGVPTGAKSRVVDDGACCDYSDPLDLDRSDGGVLFSDGPSALIDTPGASAGTTIL